MVKGRPEPAADVVQRVAATATALPEAYEEEAWTGVRWRVRKKTFAHVLVLDVDRAVPYLGPDAQECTIVTFRSSGEELLALTHAGPPYLKPPWAPTVVAMVLDDDTDWDEVAELVTDSYLLLAPQKLGRLVPGSRDGC